MGSAASTSGGDQQSAQLEGKLQPSGDLPFLQRAFSQFSASGSGASQHSIPISTLEGSFGLAPLNFTDNSESALSVFASQLGPAISQTFFKSKSGQVEWPSFLAGYVTCCKQGLGAVRLKMLLSLFLRAKDEKNLLPGLHVEGSEDLIGFVTMSQLQDLFSLCWLMMCHARLRDTNGDQSEMHVTLPDLKPLLESCYAATSGSPPGTAWKLKEEISVEKLSSWVLAIIPGISDCLAQYVQAHLQRLGSKKEVTGEDKTAGAEKPVMYPQKEESSKEMVQPGLLTLGTAWTIGLSQRDSSGAGLVTAACDLWGPGNSYPSLLYRATLHGSGMNRFWTRVEGYKGPLLMLMEASSEEVGEEKSGKWVVGAFVPGGFDNKEVFYGSSSCCLFAVAPHLSPYRSTGRETNFVYSHKRTPGAIYRSHPKPEGVGYGGSPGNERLWLNDEFTSLTVQHHAMDKSYQAGPLVPGQGYGAVKGRVAEVEVWGLGGASADEQHAVYQHRENLFSEQRRKDRNMESRTLTLASLSLALKWRFAIIKAMLSGTRLLGNEFFLVIARLGVDAMAGEPKKLRELARFTRGDDDWHGIRPKQTYKRRALVPTSPNFLSNL